MKYAIMLLIFLCTTIFMCHEYVKSKSERAFDFRDNLNNVSHKFPQYRDERWKNTKYYLTNCPKISELIRVNISTTQDMNSLVIKLVGIDNRICSLWLNGNEYEHKTLEINGITDY